MAYRWERDADGNVYAVDDGQGTPTAQQAITQYQQSLQQPGGDNTGQNVTLWGGTPYTQQGANDPVMQAFALRNAGVPLEEARSVLGNIADQVYRNTQAHNEATANQVNRNALMGFLGVAGLGLGTNFMLGSGGASVAPEALGASESLLGPATGTVEAAPVIGGAGAPAVSGVATGAGPFVPTTLGTGVASGVSGLLAGPTGSASAGGTGAVGGAAAGGSALGRILGGNGTTEDYLSTLGTLGATGLGIYGANQQADAYSDLANQYMAMGAPYRSRLESLYSDPQAYLTSPEVQVPVQQGTDALARSLSARVGNPIGNPTALQEIQNYATNQFYNRLGAERDRLAGYGGLTAYNAAAPGASSAAVGAERGIYDAVGAGLADITNPRPRQVTLSDIYRAARGGVGSLA